MNILVYIGYKAEGRISKRRLQENKARQIFRKTMISYYEILISISPKYYDFYDTNTGCVRIMG